MTRGSRGACSNGDEGGYAIVVAVTAIVVFALLAMALQASARGSLAMADAEIARARASAAADAGLMLALAAVLSDDPGGHWEPDGRARTVEFAGSNLTIRVEDERSKVPIGLLDEGQAERLLGAVGLQDERLRIARDSLLDWVDDDDDVRPDGAERAYYAPRHIVPRNGIPRSIDELALIRGFDPALVDKLRPIVTIFEAGGTFEPRYASPMALRVMSDGPEDAAGTIERQREQAGQVTALGFTPQSLAGHVLRVLVVSREPGGGGTRRSWVVQITGTSARPYIILMAE